jgi:class 3 adenylate cyclase/tetratricopeptide (TPR) repeat protein
MEETAEQIESAIAALEAQRAVLGDAVVATAIAPLHDKLAVLRLKSPGEQQRKTVTVLFMDVVGSTQLTQRLDPEEVHAVMDTALVRLTELVRARQGRVLQYAGDSLLAAFGADQSLEDDAERAVRAGLDILAEAPLLAARFRERLRLEKFDLRVGIHTGPVLLGGGVDSAGNIRGASVNIAARMEQTAPPGTLRISHETYRNVRGLFEVEAQPPLEVKGIDAPVRSYLVVRAKPRTLRAANRGLEGVDAPLVGREAELAKIQEAFHGACDDKDLALVTVVGEPGIGKSRLAFEFVRSLETLPSPVHFFQARPQPYGNNVPYGLLRDLMAWRFEILDSDAQAVAQGKLAQGLAPVLGERAAEYTALIGRLIGFDYGADRHIAAIAGEGKQIRDRAYHALARYFRLVHEQDAAPIVMVLDDLHWADDGSLDFVNHLAQSCRDVPMLLLGMTRPTLYERRPLWGSGQSHHQRIDLAPLSRRGTRQLVEALLRRLEAVPAALRDLLTTSAEGNPYFVEELVGMLIDDGVIVTDSEPWRVVADKLLDVHVPTTLAGVLQARIDGLPMPEKAALQQASVIGHVFWDEALRRIAPMSTDWLEALMRRELTYGRETSTFEGTREFVFKHHVLHQVAYQSVLMRSRREHHRVTADWLVLRSGDRASEYFGLIADHYEKAGDVANAVTYLRKAAEDAARGYVNGAALEYIGRALALVPADDAAARFALLLTRRAVYSNIGKRSEQAADVAQLEELAERLDDDAARARATGFHASLALVMADYPTVCAAAERAVALATQAGIVDVAAMARLNWGRALQAQGDYAGAERHVEEGLALARRIGDLRLESTTTGQLGILAFQVGRYGAARSYYQRALELARSIGDRLIESGMLNNLGETERTLGNYEASFEVFQAGRRICAEIGQRLADAYMLCNIAHVTLQRGDAAESLAWAGQSSELADRLGDRDLQAALANVSGHALAALGRLDEAEERYRASAALFRAIGRTTMPYEPLAGLARVALARGDVAAARATVDEIVAHFDGGGSVDGTEDPLWIHLTCHDVLAAAGAPRAREFLERGHALLQQRSAALDAGERDAFLGNVPTHRRIVAASRAAGPEGGG